MKKRLFFLIMFKNEFFVNFHIFVKSYKKRLTNCQQRDKTMLSSDNLQTDKI